MEPSPACFKPVWSSLGCRQNDGISHCVMSQGVQIMFLTIKQAKVYLKWWLHIFSESPISSTIWIPIRFSTSCEEAGQTSPQVQVCLSMFHEGGRIYSIVTDTRARRAKRVMLLGPEFPGLSGLGHDQSESGSAISAYSTTSAESETNETQSKMMEVQVAPRYRRIRR